MCKSIIDIREKRILARKIKKKTDKLNGHATSKSYRHANYPIKELQIWSIYKNVLPLQRFQRNRWQEDEWPGYVALERYKNLIIKQGYGFN